MLSCAVTAFPCSASHGRPRPQGFGESSPAGTLPTVQTRLECPLHDAQVSVAPRRDLASNIAAKRYHLNHRLMCRPSAHPSHLAPYPSSRRPNIKGWKLLLSQKVLISGSEGETISWLRRDASYWHYTVAYGTLMSPRIYKQTRHPLAFAEHGPCETNIFCGWTLRTSLKTENQCGHEFASVAYMC